MDGHVEGCFAVFLGFYVHEVGDGQGVALFEEQLNFVQIAALTCIVQCCEADTVNLFEVSTACQAKSDKVD